MASKTMDAEASFARLGEAYHEAERKRKLEIAVVALLWLVGCPLLCVMIADDSCYGTPDEHLCGLISYSVSCSMTGLYPKVFGSLMAPLFAVLVVQRTSNGLCGNLKLGWMVRFSPLVSDRAVGQDEKQRELARKLWKRIERIERKGYVAACCLIALVAFDAKDFPLVHMGFSTVAFNSLYRQNWLVGTLGKDFPEIFPTWHIQHAFRMVRWGILHLVTIYVLYFLFGTLDHFDRCNDLLTGLESMSQKVFGNPERMRWLVSVAFWYNEYAFAFMVIYVQQLEHYEIRLWEFAGASNMPYMGIVSRFSIGSAVERVIGGDYSDADLFLGVSKPTKEKMG